MHVRLRPSQQSVGAAKGVVRRLVGSRALTTVFVLTLALIGSCLYIWQRVQALDLLAEVSRLEAINQDYRDYYRKVESETQQLEQLSRIDSLAQTRFGLQRAQFSRLYAVQFPERTVGENGMRQLWNAVQKSLADMPTIQSAEVAAQELFDETE